MNRNCKKIIKQSLIICILFIAGCGDFLSITDKNEENLEVVCDNGLQDWFNSNSKFGKWIAKSTRIVKIGKKKYQPQFKDAEDEKAEWMPLFEDNDSFQSLSDAQWKIRWSLLIKKGICDAFQEADLNK